MAKLIFLGTASAVAFEGHENTYLVIRGDQASILVDCGITLRHLRKALGIDQLNSLDAIFITHEHFDHIKGLDAFCKKYDIRLCI